ncbi:MAG: 2-oxoisovalerate dehydrogenase component beta subunit [Thermoplasmata archaeon]|jgi:pyruvate/2-oxoglutarate/acetoin dehydrogenase E1 component|nr:2-oxoisovalerate dehydrogenase component beta subunit [Thermoplasmata archaeon]
MTTMTLIQAVTHTLDQAMGRDENVVVLGEDVGKNGGVFRATDGLWAKYGDARVLDTPLNESLIIGAAIGMATYGLRPVPEIQFQDFIFPGFDQLVSEAAKIRYRSGGQYNVPMVVRTPYGGGIRGGHYHSQSGEAYFAHTPGLTVVIPSNPHDAKGLLHASIASNDPVIFMEPKKIYRAVKADVNEEYFTEPIGKARVVREGDHVTLVSYGAMLPLCTAAAEAAEKSRISCEVIDLRTINPWDRHTVLASVRKTGRVVIVNEAPLTGGFAGEVSATIAEHALEYLEAPIKRVTGYDTPFPFTLENLYMPNANKVLHAVEQVVNY